ncbi:MAG: EcsC family protein [Pirellulales bacterium]|nr:EcsC family protein [Pirellulales bacterium]
MNDANPSTTLSAADQQLLADAAAYLESPGLFIRLADMLGKPAEALMTFLPDRAQKLVSQTSMDALRLGLDWAIRTLPDQDEALAQYAEKQSSPLGRWWRRNRHTALAGLTGVSGGLFGIAAAAVEIPATTVVMLRSIAGIAIEHGANLDDPATRLECLAVFSFGSKPLEDMDSAYLTARVGLAMALHQAQAYLASHTSREVAEALAKGTAPLLVRFLSRVAQRFEFVVTEQLAARLVPVVGALSGGAINAAFTDHFNRVARYHFAIVALERRHGRELVQAAYRAALDARKDKERATLEQVMSRG